MFIKVIEVNIYIENVYVNIYIYTYRTIHTYNIYMWNFVMQKKERMIHKNK